MTTVKINPNETRTASELAAEWAEIEDRINDLKSQLEAEYRKLHGPDARIGTVEVKGKSDELGLEPALVSAFAMEGVEKIRIAGRTVYIRSELVGFYSDKDRAHAALREAGYGSLVKTVESVHFNTMKSFLNELEIDPDTNLPVLPTDELQEAIEVRRRNSVRTRKS